MLTGGAIHIKNITPIKHIKRMGQKKKTSIFRCWSFDLVRLAGFEPTTPWFVAKYSIQLSYSRATFYRSEIAVVASKLWFLLLLVFLLLP